jgi:pimeloyl-ACP methyl ester carboxylesterase
MSGAARFAPCSTTEFDGRLGRVTAPALIVWGDRDGFSSRAEQDRLLGALRRAVLSIHQGAGHAPHWEDPPSVAAEIAGFVERTIGLATSAVPG